MIAETQISREIVENQEKSSSYQDLPKSNCNGISEVDRTNHSDTPYVNGNTDDPVHNMKESVVEESFITESDYAHDIKNDAVDAAVSESSKMEENSNLNPVVVISNVTLPERDGSSDVGGGIQISVNVSLEEQIGEIENRAEGEIHEIGVPCERFESSPETVNVQKENSENEAEVEIEQVEYHTGIDSWAGAERGNNENHIGNFELVSEIKWGKFDYQIKSETFPSTVENLEFQAVPVPEEEPINAHISESHNEKDECEVQNNFESEASDVCHGSQNMTADADESESQDLRTEGRKEFNLVREALDLAEHEVPLAASFDSVLHSNPTDNEETLEEEAKIALDSEVIENPKYDSGSVDKVQGVIEQVDEAKTMVDCNNKHVRITRDLVLEDKNKENGFVSHVEDSAESVERDNGVCLPAHDSETETVLFGAESVITEASSPIDSPKSQIFDNGLEITMKSTTDNASSGSDYVFGTVCIETDVPVEKTEVVVSSPHETADVKLKSEVPDYSAASIEEVSSDVTVKSRKDVSDCSDVSNKSVSDMSETADVENSGYKSDSVTGDTDDNLFVQENRDTGNSQCDRISVDSPKGSSTALISGDEMNITAVSKPFNYMIRIPRFDDESLKERVRVQKLNLDEKTKLWEAIKIQIKDLRANNQILGADYQHAKAENISAQQLVKSKRTEIDSLLHMINKANIATSIEDIDKRIYNKEHMMQHETLTLKQEKQFIRDIQQLKQQRRELLNMADQGDIKQAVEQREEVEEKLKSRRKELEILKRNVLTTDAAFVEAKRKNEEGYMKVKELQAQNRVAEELHQEAYVQWQSLKKELWQKNQHFYRYKDDAATATNIAFSRDRGTLYSHCLNQVENFMELWNTNEEFRKEYVSNNTMKTIYRLGTLDGRSLGPDEKPHILPSYANERVNKMVSTPTKVNTISQSHPELKLETNDENGTLDCKSINIVSEQVIHKEAAKSVLGNGLTTISGQSAPDQVEEAPVKSKEEIELAKKEEEKAEAKLKEKRRMEELAKAKDARERKKRQAENLQRRAELKAQKEAEEKEKKREKRLRKKERKKKVATDGSDDSNKKSDYLGPSSESAIETTTSKEIEAKEISSVSNATTKRAQKSKQSNTKHILPPPLRNCSKKKNMQRYALVGLAFACVLLVFLFFWLGNVGSYFSNIDSK